MEAEELLAKLYSLKENWVLLANGMERVYGKEDPACRAIRCCVEELEHTVLNEILEGRRK